MSLSCVRFDRPLRSAALKHKTQQPSVSRLPAHVSGTAAAVALQAEQRQAKLAATMETSMAPAASAWSAGLPAACSSSQATSDAAMAPAAVPAQATRGRAVRRAQKPHCAPSDTIMGQQEVQRSASAVGGAAAGQPGLSNEA